MQVASYVLVVDIKIQM